jgi:putative flippase GtrA
MRDQLARATQSLVNARAVLFRFGVVGCVNAGVSYLVFRVLIFALSGSSHRGAVAQLFSYLAGMATSYVLNRAWTFRAFDSASVRLARFLTAQALCLVMTVASLGLFVDKMGFPSSLTWLVVNAIITIANFLLQRLWVFAPAGVG